MPSSWVEIANSALIKIGTGTINGFNDLTKAEQLTKERYPKARDAVLRLHPWNCAVSRVLTASLASPVPAFGYEYYHELPSDCLRVINVGPDGENYKIEGRYIATDSTELELTYIQRIEDPTLLDYLCAEAIACYLAWDLSTAFLDDDAQRQRMWRDFSEVLRQAKSVDGKEDPMSIVEAEDWLNSRMTSPGIDRSMNWAN